MSVPTMSKDVSKQIDLLTVEDLGSLLRLTRDAIYSQRVRGQMPGSLGVHLGKRLFFRRSDIEAYLDGQFDRKKGTGDECPDTG